MKRTAAARNEGEGSNPHHRAMRVCPYAPRRTTHAEAAHVRTHGTPSMALAHCCTASPNCHAHHRNATGVQLAPAPSIMPAWRCSDQAGHTHASHISLQCGHPWPVFANRCSSPSDRSSLHERADGASASTACNMRHKHVAPKPAHCAHTLNFISAHAAFSASQEKRKPCLVLDLGMCMHMVLNMASWRNETCKPLFAYQHADRFDTNPKHSRQWVKVI